MDRRRSSTPARGRSKARSAARKRKRARSFEELFSYQKKVQQQRKAYPRTHVDELVTWMRHGKLAAAGKMLRDIRSARGTPEELVEKRKALFDERDEILQCAKAPPQVMSSSSKLVEYLGGADKQVVVVDEPDPQTAEDLHAAWFEQRNTYTIPGPSLFEGPLPTQFA